MIYRLLHWISGIMLHWFYSEIRVERADRIPPSGPLLVAVNHPNAMVDSLVAGWVVPRRLRLTAKATLLRHPAVALLFKMIGVVPLRRADDHLDPNGIDRTRNRKAFEEIIDVLRSGGSVQIFPEGKSNSDELLPLKTGLARIALEAKRNRVRSLSILPIGLVFENKAEPGTRVLARIGQPIDVDSWKGESPRELTSEIASRLAEASRPAVFLPAEPVPAVPRKNAFVRAASWWGRTTHEIPIRYARALAVTRSTDADQPAMLTMLFGIGLVVASYAIHLAVVGLLTRSVLLSLLYLATLITGAYWTAFEAHPR
jgi:1-acyl-sn-glycerol-3-phosphate acyltransferase